MALVLNHVPDLMARLCLVMIVRDEAHVMERCLDSCLGLVSMVRIVDTGSADGTPEVIEAWAKKNRIDCQVEHREWIDFATNRNQALKLGHETNASHLLLLDADEEIRVDSSLRHRLLGSLFGSEELLFSIPMVFADGTVVPRINLVRNSPRLEYRFRIHEDLFLDGKPCPSFSLVGNPRDWKRGPHCTTKQDGARSLKAGKLERDIETLTKAWEEEQHPRYLFFLAQTNLQLIRGHMTKGEEVSKDDLEGLIHDYQHFLSLAEPSDPNRYVAALWMARAMEHTREPKEVIDAFLEAHKIDTLRPEALGSAAAFALAHGAKDLARDLAGAVARCRGSENFAFLEPHWYETANDILQGAA